MLRSALRHRRLLILLIVVVGFLAIRPVHFHDPNSTVLLARNGELLGARVATDGQWRFPESDSLPMRYKKALICFEDRYFYYHPGVNPIAIGRALVQNIRQGNIDQQLTFPAKESPIPLPCMTIYQDFYTFIDKINTIVFIRSLGTIL